MSSFRVLILVALAACHHSSSGTTGPGTSPDACDRAARNAYVAAEGRASPGSGEFERTVTAIAQVCRTDHWSDAMLECMTTTKDLKNDDHCVSMFSDEQKQHVETAYEAGKERHTDQAEVATEPPTESPPPSSDSSITADDTKASLEMARQIIRMLGSLGKSFSDMKGDLVTKASDGTNAYAPTGTGVMMAETEYVMVKPSGSAFYVASWKDSKKVTMSFSAFTGGILLVTNRDGNFAVEQDKDKSTSTKLVYILTLKGQRVASYTMDTGDKSGTLIIGFL